MRGQKDYRSNGDGSKDLTQTSCIYSRHVVNQECLEVHLDIFDNRLEITSPGGMVEGLPIQKRDLYHIASRRRNPYLADIFHRLQLMERSGSGIKEIMNDYKASANITEDRLPTFFSDESDFNVTFWNLNYGVEQSESKGSNREHSCNS